MSQIKEKDILAEGTYYWVLRVNGSRFEVLEKMGTHSEVVDAYTEQSLAIARYEYLEKRKAK